MGGKNYVSGAAGLLRIQAAFMRAGIATPRETIHIAVRDEDELDAILARARITALPQGSGGTLPAATLAFPAGSSTDTMAANRGLGLSRASKALVRIPYDARPFPGLRNDILSMRPYFVEIPVHSIDEQPLVEGALRSVKERLLHRLSKNRRNAHNEPAIYWSAGMRFDRSTQSTSLDVQLDTDYSVWEDIPMECIDRLQDCAGIETSLEIGMASTVLIGDSWASSLERVLRPGRSIGGHGSTVTATAIVAARSAELDAQAPPGEKFCISVGHGFPNPQSAQDFELRVYLPSNARSVDNEIGHVAYRAYDPVHNGDLEFDVGLVRLREDVGGDNRMGRKGWLLRTKSRFEAQNYERAHFYGAASGLKQVAIRRTDVVTEFKGRSSELGTMRVYMNGLIEVVEQDRADRQRPVAKAGDSGAPLVVEDERGQHCLVGYLVAAGTLRGKRRHPRTFAAPIDRVFDLFAIGLAQV